MARNSRGRSNSGVALSLTKFSGIACGSEHGARARLRKQEAERQRDGVGEQRADHRRGDELVVAADAAVPGMRHRREHHEARDAIRIIERHPRAERAGQRMHDDDDADRCRVLPAPPRSSAPARRASNPPSGRARSSHGRDGRSGSRGDVVRACRRAAGASPRDWSLRHGAAGSAGRRHRLRSPSAPDRPHSMTHP